MTWAEGLIWLDRRHPDWQEHAETMNILGACWMDTIYKALHRTKSPHLAYDDLYHVVTNMPGCASISEGDEGNESSQQVV